MLDGKKEREEKERATTWWTKTKKKLKTEEEQHQLLYLGFSIHQEVASKRNRIINYIYSLEFYFLFLMKSHLQSYPCPLQINSFWNLGFLLGITIILQIITGIFLGLHYTSEGHRFGPEKKRELLDTICNTRDYSPAFHNLRSNRCKNS